jgi:hypothetical protein
MKLAALIALVFLAGCSTTNPGAPADWLAPLVSPSSLSPEEPAPPQWGMADVRTGIVQSTTTGAVTSTVVTIK